MLLEGEPPRRPRPLVRALIGVALALGLALGGYAVAFAPDEGEAAWVPPAGVSAEETPTWLQTLCAKSTPELCAAANRARDPQDCDAMRAALRAVEGVEQTLSARGALSPKQHWVLTVLYGQGHQLCKFVRGKPAAKPPK